MSRQLSLDVKPPEYHGSPTLETFDRMAFTKSLEILAARTAAAKTGRILTAPQMRGSIMNLQRIRTVDFDPSDPENCRLVLLRVSNKAQLPSDALSFLESETKGLVPYTLTLDYDYWTADEVLRTILPEHLRKETPSGFAITGHIAHVNLNAEYLPYKHLIGRIILDKNKKIKTVVNKLDSIDSPFRFFKMELIAGEPNFVVEHHESDCAFTFDFREVYWNSRLHSEHNRLVQMFGPDDVVADVFAGVGPFAIPAGKKGSGVFANDLNPNSAKYLTTNVYANRVDGLVRVSCEDGRNFIRSVFRRAFDNPFPASSGPRLSKTQQDLARRRRKKAGRQSPVLDWTPTLLPPRRRISHFVMNLPDSAITFLDAFRGVLASNVEGLQPDKAEADIRQRVEEKLGAVLTTDVSLHLVRSVSPGKEMYCISFRLPSEVLLSASE
ncbi:putative specifically methylates the N1 position of guanosine-37 in various cytoplasmic and mitochondrial tRNAs [Lyophyllum shimeji]|uniref:tRNA (guanine(37)-N1)-methyltransferase n=1 Tax=Lyophyllum shimeji TaxID=47721 RepID=A0A9P3PI61_LYOSH|nr:putative specifically methylates the N1 position of guanosine-37 in various cytoplasmic and mitochondrial tRNAs [Lyophyllum shimeji]